MRNLFLCLAVLIACVIMASGRVVISEIMYAPRAYQDLFEFIEIHNTGPNPVTLTGWSLPVVQFTFPTSSIAPGEYKVVVGNVKEFERAYAHLRGTNLIIGGYTKAADAEDCKSCLSDKGAEVRLLDAQRNVVSSVTYDNKKGWSQLASGFGASLELICLSDGIDINNPGYWSASSLPQHRDIHTEFGGTPGLAPRWMSCFGPKAIKFPNSVVFTEIMYHPVGKKTRTEQHEFIEVSNRLSSDIDVSYWRIVSDSGVRYTFPFGTTLRSGAHVVIAKDIAEFRAVYGNNGTTTLLGPYGGELANGECRVAIIDNNGFVRDYLRYDDKEPWPRAADALGASTQYLPRNSAYRNEAAFKYKGQSLTRRTFSWDSDKPETWYARTPTPGQPNLDRLPLLPIIGKVKTTPKKNLIRADADVTLEFELSPWPINGLTLARIYVMNFRDEVIADTAAVGTIRNVTAVYNEQDKVFRATLPKRPANTVVRYKIFAHFGANGNDVVTSPHQKDPFEYHSLFYSPPPHPTTPVIHLFLRPAQWNNLRIWAEAGRWDGCRERNTWENKIPCTVVYSEDGSVLPCFTRYQGSQYNRRNGVDIAGFPFNPPPGGIKAYSYNIKLPNYGKIEKSRDVILHKMWQGCPMYEAPIINRVMEEAGVMGSHTSFARLNINGGFLRLMMVLYPGSSSWVDRWNQKANRRCIHQSAEGISGIGELYKVGGSHTDVGDSGPGDWRVFGPFCQHSALDRYKATYSLSTNKDFATHVTLSNHIQHLNSVILTDRVDLAARRKWLSDNFDINLLLNYMVVINWAGTWDQVFHNQLLYRRETDRKWSWHPWDADALYQQAHDANLYAGDNTQTHLLRRAIIKNFKNELDDRYRLFQNTLHSKAKMTGVVQWANSRYDRNQAKNEGYGRVTQNLDDCINKMNAFMNGRWDHVNRVLGGFRGTNADAELKKITCPAKPTVRIYNMNYTAYPGYPINFASTRRTTNSIVLSWFPPNSFGREILSYTVRRATPGQQLESHPTRPSVAATRGNFGAITFVDDNLTPGTPYRYSVGAVIRGGQRVVFSPPLTVSTENENNNNGGGNNNNANDNNNNNNANNNNNGGGAVLNDAFGGVASNPFDAAVAENSQTYVATTPVNDSPNIALAVGISVGVLLFIIVMVVVGVVVLPRVLSKQEQV